MPKYHVIAYATVEYEYDKVIDAADTDEAVEIAHMDAIAEGFCTDTDIEVVTVDLEEDV